MLKLLTMSSININVKIRAYLNNRRQQLLNTIQVDEALLIELVNDLREQDLPALQAKNETELATNCSTYWTRADESLAGILFEYDNYLTENAEAVASLITFGDFRDWQVEPYGFGTYCTFAQKAQAADGIILSTVNPLAKIRITEKQLTNVSYYDLPGYSQLINAYMLTSFLVLHNAISEFIKTDSYKSLKRQQPFSFVIREHDNGSTYPLYVVHE